MKREGKRRRAAPGRVTVIGFTADGTVGADGQIRKSRAVRDALIDELGRERVLALDSGDRSPLARLRLAAGLLAVPFRRNCVLIPGITAVRRLLPYLDVIGRISPTRIHLVAVGGWLPSEARGSTKTATYLARCAGIYVETRRMQTELEGIGLNNVVLFRNFRALASTRPPPRPSNRPLRFVFLSRVTPSKGVGELVEAFRRVLAETEPGLRPVLDIYGPVASKDAAWWRDVLEGVPGAVTYRGTLEPHRVPDELPNYDAIIFPSYYPGEGMPGVLVEAMVSGLAAIATDWKENGEVVEHGRNGLLVPPKDVEALAAAIRACVRDPERVTAMKREAHGRAAQYDVERILPILTSRLSGQPQG